VEDRRYRQRGYRDTSGPKPPQRDPSPAPPPSSPLKSRPVSRCAGCGAVLPIATGSLSRCPHCGAELHACAQCTHFDAGRRFECRQPIPERISNKRAANTCALFSLRVTVEREAGSRPGDARRGFDDLFK
jgi:predicted RNA-binding Zn-ribbon protein involved in translation (DUF1610 family)